MQLMEPTLHLPLVEGTCPCFQARAVEDGEEPAWDLQRFVPLLQEILEEHAAGSLKQDEFPYVNPPSDAGAVTCLPSSLLPPSGVVVLVWYACACVCVPMCVMCL